MVAKVGNKDALDAEYVIIEIDGIEIYVDTNLDVRGRLKKC